MKVNKIKGVKITTKMNFNFKLGSLMNHTAAKLRDAPHRLFGKISTNYHFTINISIYISSNYLILFDPYHTIMLMWQPVTESNTDVTIIYEFFQLESYLWREKFLVVRSHIGWKRERNISKRVWKPLPSIYVLKTWGWRRVTRVWKLSPSVDMF